MQTRTIGDRTVGAIGIGAMPMSARGRPPVEQSIATMHAALDAGVTLVDTADAYQPHGADPGHNELLVAEALRTYAGSTSTVLVATKGGHTRGTDGGWGLNGRPEHLKRACEDSLRRLGTEAIDLYQFHRPDPEVPYAESVGALADLLDEGKVRAVGISNADPDQIRLANDILDERLVSVQNEFSLDFRSSEPEVEMCEKLGITFLPWSPFGGRSRFGGLSERHPVLEEIGAVRGATPYQVCLAWMLAKSPTMIPIPGASRPESIRSSAVAADLELTTEEFTRVNGD